MDKKLEPRIGETFTLDGMTLKCVRDGAKEGFCSRCALLHGMRCIEMKCDAQSRADFTHVHFVRVQDGRYE